MPLYEYECTECEEQFERVVVLADYKNDQPCPECGSAAKRIISIVNVGSFSAMSAEAQRESLLRRSKEHTARTVKKDGIPQFQKKKKKKTATT